MTNSTKTFELACALIAQPSVTPDDAGCQRLLVDRLTRLGFRCDEIAFGEVTNLWAIRGGRGAAIERPIFAFAGHTDVVPPGPLANWTSDPFSPTVRDGRLYGRGASDMKTSVAAFVVAVEEFLTTHSSHAGSIAVLLTSDEEGPGVDGTIKVCERLKMSGEAPDFCLVGEPTSVNHVGDTIKNGRRGTLSGKLTVIGVQGHIAYPHLARNPIHLAAPAIDALVSQIWDDGNAHYLPTSFQISNVHAGTGVGNVIPGEINYDFNFRYSTESDFASLTKRTEAVLDAHGLQYRLKWTHGGEPFLTQPGVLSDAIAAAILDETGITTELSTTGGTSDGRFIAKICAQVIEFGPPNDSIHKINENIRLDEIEPLKNIYRRTLENLLVN